MINDLIRRQDAIDALKKIMFTHLFECGEYIGEDTREFSIVNAEKALDVIEALPSAEPERTAKVMNDGINYCENCEGYVEAPMAYCPYCGCRLEWK